MMKKLSVDERIIEIDKILQSFFGLPKTPETIANVRGVLNKYFNAMVNTGHYTQLETDEFLYKLSLLGE